MNIFLKFEYNSRATLLRNWNGVAEALLLRVLLPSLALPINGHEYSIKSARDAMVVGLKLAANSSINGYFNRWFQVLVNLCQINVFLIISGACVQPYIRSIIFQIMHMS